jgi:hypothetical protein
LTAKDLAGGLPGVGMFSDGSPLRPIQAARAILDEFKGGKGLSNYWRYVYTRETLTALGGDVYNTSPIQDFQNIVGGEERPTLVGGDEFIDATDVGAEVLEKEVEEVKKSKEDLGNFARMSLKDRLRKARESKEKRDEAGVEKVEKAQKKVVKHISEFSLADFDKDLIPDQLKDEWIAANEKELDGALGYFERYDRMCKGWTNGLKTGERSKVLQMAQFLTNRSLHKETYEDIRKINFIDIIDWRRSVFGTKIKGAKLDGLVDYLADVLQMVVEGADKAQVQGKLLLKQGKHSELRVSLSSKQKANITASCYGMYGAWPINTINFSKYSTEWKLLTGTNAKELEEQNIEELYKTQQYGNKLKELKEKMQKERGKQTMGKPRLPSPVKESISRPIRRNHLSESQIRKIIRKNLILDLKKKRI